MVNGINTITSDLTNLEEYTFYTIAMQAISGNRMSGNSNEASVTTYSDGECYIISCQRMSCYNSTFPNSSPQDVIATGIHPGSLNISWGPPEKINQNGQITGYIIQYTLVWLNVTMLETVTNGTRYILPGLFPFTNYSVEVAAMTVNGTGPLSDPVFEISGHEGEYMNS